jgi:hypothetical protein
MRSISALWMGTMEGRYGWRYGLALWTGTIDVQYGISRRAARLCGMDGHINVPVGNAWTMHGPSRDAGPNVQYKRLVRYSLHAGMKTTMDTVNQWPSARSVFKLKGMRAMDAHYGRPAGITYTGQDSEIIHGPHVGRQRLGLEREGHF